MTFPNVPTQGSTSANAPTAKPQPAPPLTDEQLRLQCVELAVRARVDVRFITTSAEAIRNYVKTGNTGSSNRVGQGG